MPGPVIKVPKLPTFADPAEASVFDPLYKTLLRRAASALGLNDPNTAITSMAAPMAVVGRGASKLEPILVNMYKQRLKADPTLAHHPGLQQLPEFQEAFKALWPTWEIVPPGQTVPKPFSQRMREMPEPPTTRGLDPRQVAAETVSTLEPKVPRTVTQKELRISKGLSLQGRAPGRVLKYPPERQAQIRAEAEKWTGPKRTLAEKLGLPEGSLYDILRRAREAAGE